MHIYFSFAALSLFSDRVLDMDTTFCFLAAQETKYYQEEKKVRVDTMWEKMNNKAPIEKRRSFPKQCASNIDRVSSKRTSGWMTYLGLDSTKENIHCDSHLLLTESSHGIKKIPTDVPTTNESVFTYSQEDRVEKGGRMQMSGVDAVLEQIKKKSKISVIEKTKKDWGDFKEENQKVEEELDAYKKSSQQYLDKLSFLDRADFREFERERDIRLAIQARRRPDNM